MKGRYAPSPTGAIHLGNARTALVAWLAARGQGSGFVMRIEDLDRPRIAPGGEERLLDDLRWLGITWDEGPDVGGPAGPYRQSERTARYDATISELLAKGRAYLCACSRADVARAASAPHGDDDEGPRYPGTCRGRDPAAVTEQAAKRGRRPSVRFCGTPEGVDDFVLRRADGVAAYQLAVVVDDAAMGIEEVVRGADLLTSTPRQLGLYQALGLPAPVFAHVPLVLSQGGERLAKRTRPLSIAALRERGVPADVAVGALAASAGLCAPGDRVTPAALVSAFSFEKLPPEPVVIRGLDGF
ncbi:MAG TPA: glutamate--tRNA ligase family protein [Polyangia bacterium]|jgi:glutamyl-tRNA synthetase|nr:glutamate--tRNA ligase family protein [Polyangia bacterium]